MSEMEGLGRDGTAVEVGKDATANWYVSSRVVSWELSATSKSGTKAI